MLVAFIGIDGSGKTTISLKVTKLLNEMNEKSIYISPFRYIFLNYFLEFVKRKGDATGVNPYLTVSKKPFPARLWPYLALIDNLMFFFVKIRPLLAKYKYVICDRYFYDFYLSFEYYGYADEFIKLLCFKILPKPDLTFVLDVPPKIAYERKKEHPLNFYVEQRRRYLHLASRFNLNLIDTSKEFDENLKKIIKTLKPKAQL